MGEGGEGVSPGARIARATKGGHMGEEVGVVKHWTRWGLLVDMVKPHQRSSSPPLGWSPVFRAAGMRALQEGLLPRYSPPLRDRRVGAVVGRGVIGDHLVCH